MFEANLKRRQLIAGGLGLLASSAVVPKLWAKPNLKANPFTLGVAAGDPWPEGGATAYLDNPYLPDSFRQIMIENGVTSTPLRRTYEIFGQMGDISERESLTIGATFAGELPHAVRWEAFWQYGRSTNDITAYNATRASRFIAARDVIADPVSGEPVCRDEAARAAGCVPLNIFSFDPLTPVQREYMIAPRRKQREKTQLVYGGRVAGSPLSLQPGHVAQPGARIPKVDEVLGEFSKTNVTFFAETKVPKPAQGIADVDPVEFARLVDVLVRKHGVVDRFILQSSDYRTIDALHEINPRIRTCLLGAHNWDHHRFLDTVRQHHASCILLRDTNAGKGDVTQLQKAGVQVYSEVIDTPEDWQKYIDLGVDVLFTNAPADLIDFLAKGGFRR